MHDRFLLKLDLIRQLNRLNKPRSWADMLLDHLDDQHLDAQQALTTVQNVMRQVAAGRHMVRILKFAYFHGLKLTLFDEVLIPRPDTETMVEAVDADQGDIRIVDWCTGSGCVGLALAEKYPISTVLMLDKYPAPCANAHLNVGKLGVAERALVLQADFFGPWPFEKADVITINPPYLAADDAHLKHLAEDPVTALVADDNGMSFYRHLFGTARQHLEPGGQLLVELGFDQAESVLQLALAANWHAPVFYKDMAGHDRVLKVRNI